MAQESVIGWILLLLFLKINSQVIPHAFQLGLVIDESIRRRVSPEEAFIFKAFETCRYFIVLYLSFGLFFVALLHLLISK